MDRNRKNASPRLALPLQDGERITYLPAFPTRLAAQTDHDFRIITPLLKNQEFFQQIERIRERFNISSGGMHPLLGATETATPNQLERNREKFENDMALTYDEQILKKFSYPALRSRRRKFQAALTKLRRDWKLPARFQYPLAVYVRYYAKDGLWPTYGTHSARVLIRIQREHGELRMYLEIFGDTKKRDVIKAWNTISTLQRQYELPGQHLYRHEQFYNEERLAAGQKAVHPVTGIEEERPCSDSAKRYESVKKHRGKRRKENP